MATEMILEAWVLRNKRYYIVFPQCPKPAADLMVRYVRQIHGDKLAYAQLVRRRVSNLTYMNAGSLVERGLL